jgi:hypothetical protein
MKKRRLLLILLGFVASITLTYILWPCEREPQCDGVSLSKWLERYNRHDPQPTEAIHNIGTNALPYLIKWIQYEPPIWRTALNHLREKLPASIQNARGLGWLFQDKAEHRADLAVEAFSVLGSKADPVMGELLRLALVENPKTPIAQRRATQCLMNMSVFLRSGDFEDGSRIR